MKITDAPILRKYVLNTGHWVVLQFTIYNITIILHKLTELQSGYKDIIALRHVKLSERYT